MLEIDLSNLIVDGRPPVPSVVAQLAVAGADSTPHNTSDVSRAQLTPREFARQLLNRILDQARSDALQSITLLTKLIPNLLQSDQLADPKKLIEILINGNDSKFIQLLLKDQENSNQQIPKSDIGAMRQRLESLIKAELKDESIGELLQILDSSEAPAVVLEKLDEKMPSVIRKNELTPTSRQQIAILLQLSIKDAIKDAHSNGGAISVQPREIFALLEKISQVTDHDYRQMATKITAKLLQCTLAESIADPTSKSGQISANAVSVPTSFGANPHESIQAHRFSARATLIEFLFSPPGATEDLARALKLIVDSASIRTSPSLDSAIQSLATQIETPLLELTKLVCTVESELSSQPNLLAPKLIKSIRQQLYLVLEHSIALAKLEDPLSLLTELRDLERNPERTATARANQVVALADRLLRELEREHKLPATRLLEKLQRARTQIEDQPIVDLNDKAVLLASVDRLIRGQDLVRQITPVLHALGEPSVFFFPSFLSGLFSQLEVLTYPTPKPEADQQGNKQSREDPLKTIEFRTSFNRLGQTEVKIQYGQRRIFVTLGFTCAAIVPLVQSRIPILERNMRELGFDHVGLSTHAINNKPVSFDGKFSTKITA